MYFLSLSLARCPDSNEQNAETIFLVGIFACLKLSSIKSCAALDGVEVNSIAFKT